MVRLCARAAYAIKRVEFSLGVLHDSYLLSKPFRQKLFCITN